VPASRALSCCRCRATARNAPGLGRKKPATTSRGAGYPQVINIVYTSYPPSYSQQQFISIQCLISSAARRVHSLELRRIGNDREVRCVWSCGRRLPGGNTSVRAVAATTAPDWSVTACYIGGNVGAGWADSNFRWTNITEKLDDDARRGRLFRQHVFQQHRYDRGRCSPFFQMRRSRTWTHRTRKSSESE
jgi:hypothetical protein